jgi:hypothetical protein
MSLLSPRTLPQAVNLVHVRIGIPARGNPQDSEAVQRLRSLDGPLSWRAALLALMVVPDSALDRQAWCALVDNLPPPHSARLFDDIAQLPNSQRLPWFEHFARLLAPGPVAQRHELIGAARSLLTADGLVSSMDQLRWIALRHLLAGSAVAPPVVAATEFETLDRQQVLAICVYCGFLSTLVPTPEIHFDPTGYGSVSQDWYDSVTAPWIDHTDVPARQGHDIDAALRALRELQAMPWLLRPMLVRSWFDGARALTDGPALHAGAADALRLSCVLLDSPVPPELGQQYIEVEHKER